MSEGYTFINAEVGESDSAYAEDVLHFSRSNFQVDNDSEDQQEAAVIYVDPEYAIEPETLQVQVDEGDPEDENYYCMDSDGNEYAIISTDNDEEVIEAEYIDFENSELEEGEIRDENLYRALRSGYSLNELYVCSICQRSFTQKGNLLRHYQTHTGDRPFACRLCGHRFTQKSNLQKHIATHNGDKNFECGVCFKGFVQKANLIRHLRIHTGEKPFECNLCGHKFTQKGNLNKHMQLHTSNTVSVCDYCGSRFSSYTAKMRHVSSVHNDKVPEYDDDEDIHDNQCDECPATFRTKLALRKHKKFHK